MFRIILESEEGNREDKSGDVVENELGSGQGRPR